MWFDFRYKKAIQYNPCGLILGTKKATQYDLRDFINDNNEYLG